MKKPVVFVGIIGVVVVVTLVLNLMQMQGISEKVGIGLIIVGLLLSGVLVSGDRMRGNSQAGTKQGYENNLFLLPLLAGIIMLVGSFFGK